MLEKKKLKKTAQTKIEFSSLFLILFVLVYFILFFSQIPFENFLNEKKKDSFNWDINPNWVVLKVRPRGLQVGHTTLYKKVVWHKTCRGHAKSCATNVHISTIFFYKFGATATWKMMNICSNYVRQHTTSLWDYYVARISFEADQHLAVHDLGRTT